MNRKWIVPLGALPVVLIGALILARNLSDEGTGSTDAWTLLANAAGTSREPLFDSLEDIEPGAPTGCDVVVQGSVVDVVALRAFVSSEDPDADGGTIVAPEDAPTSGAVHWIGLVVRVDDVLAGSLPSEYGGQVYVEVLRPGPYSVDQLRARLVDGRTGYYFLRRPRDFPGAEAVPLPPGTYRLAADAAFLERPDGTLDSPLLSEDERELLLPADATAADLVARLLD